MKNMTAKKRFIAGTFGILIIFCGGASIGEYYFLKEQVKNSVIQKTDIFLAAAAATRSYVKDTLRPKMFSIVNEDKFILEAMSTSYISREIMNGVKDRFPGFIYKRAASNPRNPVNMADSFEVQMLEWFSKNPESREWSGMIEKDGKSFYSRLMPISVEAPCLSCHGVPEDAPSELINIYGSEASFGYRVGDVVAADTIYIPMDNAILNIKEKAWVVFFMGTSSLLVLLGMFFLLFDRTVLNELKNLLYTYTRAMGKNFKDVEKLAGDTGDEFEQLKGAFENTAHKLLQTHDELKVSELKYRRHFETSIDAIIICEKDSTIVDINLSGINLFGFNTRSEALQTETFYQLFWDGRDAAYIFEEAKNNGFVKEAEIPIVNSSGIRVDCLVTAISRKDENNEFNGIEIVIRDVSEKKRLDKYITQTEKMASIGQLAAGVAHEINNPLGVINCYSNLIKKGVEPGSQISEDIEVIQKHTESCRKVVESLLNFARVSEPNMSKVDIHSCIEEILSVLSPELIRRRIVVTRHYSEFLPLITVDEHKIKQVFMNLFLNSVHAMEKGGKFTINTKLSDDRERFVIEICDTGKGIPPQYIDKIFEPFFTTKEAGEGTGLGLSISYGILKQHGGDIDVKSSAGSGTTFTISLNITD